MQKTVSTSEAEKLPRCGSGCDTSHDRASAYSAFFNTANGGVNGPLSTRAEKEFSQIGLALRFNSAGEIVGTRTAVGARVGVLVDAGSGASLGSMVGLVVDVTAGAD